MCDFSSDSENNPYYRPDKSKTKGRFRVQKLLTLISIFTLATFFQNCSGFVALDKSSFDNLGSSAPILPTAPELTFQSLNECLLLNSSDVISCLDGKNETPTGLTQALVDQCITDNGSASFDVALCLHEAGFPSDQYRRPRQSDIKECNDELGPEKIAECLLENGLLPAQVDQNIIDVCIEGQGLNSVEKCLRGESLLPAQFALTQKEVDDCRKIDGELEIATCLHNAEVLDEAILQPTIDNCIALQGPAQISACLRANNFIPSATHQIHVDVCASEYGATGIETCFIENGLGSTLTVQAEIDTCILAGGLATTAQCLRSKKLLPNILENEDVLLCHRINGPAEITNCITRNGYTTDGLAQLNVDQCIATQGLQTVANCLQKAAFIPSKFTQLIAADGVFGMNCVGCHNAATPNGGLNLADFATITARLVPGDAVNSLIHMRMNDAVAPMPQAGLLTPELIKRVRLWINDGAQNN